FAGAVFLCPSGRTLVEANARSNHQFRERWQAAWMAGLYSTLNFESWHHHADESADEGASSGSAHERDSSGDDFDGRRSSGVGSRLYQAGATAANEHSR